MPLEGLLATVDVKVIKQVAAKQSDKGGKLIEQPASSDFGAFLQQKGDFIEVVRVVDDGAAQLAGLSAGDQIVAVNQLKFTHAQLETLLQHSEAGSQWTVIAFRRDELMSFNVTLQQPEANQVLLKAEPNKLLWPNELTVE